MPGKAQLPPSVSHGTTNAYVNYGCRCQDCREAQSRYRSERRALNPEQHAKYMREYRRRKREETSGL
jgi:hypothetical protein